MTYMGPPRSKHLTRRETQVIEHVIEGDTVGETARALGISPLTVRRHRQNVLTKLGVHTQAAAVAIWLRQRAEAEARSGLLRAIEEAV